ncbi:hypothetical protein D3C80_2158910 [compost metagenome]
MKAWLDRRKASEYKKANFSIEGLQELQLNYDRAVQQLLQLNLNAYGPVEGQRNFEQQMQSILSQAATAK